MRTIVTKWVFIAALLPALAPAADLSRYRGFQFGTDLATVAKQAGVDASQVRVLHVRPALIQELDWTPRSLGASSQAESAKDVLFSFYNGELYRVAVNYDRYELEGLTAQDIVDAVSVGYGIATKPATPVNDAQERYGDRDVILARWQDPQYCFDLFSLSVGPSFSLIGVQRRLEAAAQVAILEAKRLDDQEAPQRDAARIVSEREAERATLEKARLANKPKFRP